MDNIKIGTPVINTNYFWCSGYVVKKDDPNNWKFIKDKNDREISKKHQGYIDCVSRHREKGISGVIIDVNAEWDIYLIKWFDGTLCGKPLDAFKVDYVKLRDDKLKDIGI